MEDENEVLHDSEKGSTIKEFVKAIELFFLPADTGKDCIMKLDSRDEEENEQGRMYCDEIFDDLSSNGFIGFREVKSLLRDIEGFEKITDQSDEKIRALVMSASKDERGLNRDEFYELMKCQQF